MFESKLNVLEQENDSIYPNFSIFLKQYFEEFQNFSCKVEIPSKKHPGIFYSNSFKIIKLVISVSHARDNRHHFSRCTISANKIITKPYEVSLVDSNGDTLETKTLSESKFYSFR